MSILHIPVFHGMAPRRAPRKLTQAQSVNARNCELFSEELRPLRTGIDVDVPSKEGDIETIYLLGSLWLHWTTDVDVVRSPLYLENQLRVHYSGDYFPKSTDDTLAEASPGTDYPTDYYRLGLPPPDNAPTVGSTGGSANDIERSYVYSFVSPWGEEGPPSDPGAHVGKSDATSWDLTAIDETPPNSFTISNVFVNLTTLDLVFTENHFLETSEYIEITGQLTGSGALLTAIAGVWQVTRIDETTVRIPLDTTGAFTGPGTTAVEREAPINTGTGWTRRIYRTLAGDFRFVADITSGTTYTDAVSDVALGEDLPGGLVEASQWKSPNGNIKGLTGFPGGSLVGFFGNTVAFSEPNVPSAWPEAYQYTFNFTVVSIAVVGNMVVVATDGFPSLIIGDNPAAMVQTQLEVFQACVSKRGMASLVNGAIYPSPDGLVYVPSAGMPQVITQPYFKKKDWQEFGPTSMIANVYDDRYYGFYTNGGENRNESGGIVFDVKEPGATFTTLSIQADALHSDIEADNLFIMSGNTISQYDSGGSYLIYTWLSKLFTVASPVCFKCAKVKLTLGEGVTTSELNAALLAAIAAVDLQLEATALSAVNGADNNYISGAIAGGPVCQYTVAGGPYTDAVADLGRGISAFMDVYAWYDDGSGDIARHHVHRQQLTNSKPFRIGNVAKGYLADQWEVEFNCNDAIIHEVTLATSMIELKRI